MGGEARGEIAEMRPRSAVICHAEAINIEKAVTGGHLGFCGLFGVDLRVVREELGEVVLVYLFGDGVFRCWVGC